MPVNAPPSLSPGAGVGSTVGLVLPGAGARAPYQVGVLRAIAAGQSELPDWDRHQRLGRRESLTTDHLMASMGVPLLFPPVNLDGEYYGDGAQRQLWPLSPAIHLGADRLLIIGVRSEQGAGVNDRGRAAIESPTMGQLFGYMLDTLFMDQIYANVEHVARLNQIVETAPQALPGMHKVATPLIVPSVDLRVITTPHIQNPPRTPRPLMRDMVPRGT